jgi:hypothetical protein
LLETADLLRLAFGPAQGRQQPVARMAMIAMTTSNSMSVNARKALATLSCRFVGALLYLNPGAGDRNRFISLVRAV